MLPLVDDGFLTLKEDTHQYFDQAGQEYNSVSSVISTVTMPFDAKRISRSMTGSQAEADALQREWRAKNRRSIEWGNAVHNECENFIRYGSVGDSSFRKLEDELYRKLTKRYARNHAERILRDQDRLICGTGDHLGERSKVRNANLVVDINDFKTNLAKGVRNDKAKIDEQTKEVVRYYNQFLLYPLEHLEASDYVKYCLQLSMYGVMLEKYGVRVGSMNLYYIDQELTVSEIFVPYMRMEAILLMDNFIQLRNVDGTPKSQYLKRKEAKSQQQLGTLIKELDLVEELDENEWI